MVLQHLLEATRERIISLPGEFPSRSPDPPRSLSASIRSVKGKNAVIGEIKLASPAEGSFRCPFTPLHLAEELVAAGCAGLSIITEPTYFGGSLSLLETVREVSPLPVLRKDFIIDERQVYETRAMGADAILLIAGILTRRLPRFVDLSLDLGLEPLVEVHTLQEIGLALQAEASLVGINNRNLNTMTVDLTTTLHLFPHLKGEGRTVISMSGIETPDDIRHLKGFCHAFLIGTSLMKSAHPRTTAEGFIFA